LREGRGKVESVSNIHYPSPEILKTFEETGTRRPGPIIFTEERGGRASTTHYHKNTLSMGGEMVPSPRIFSKLTKKRVGAFLSLLFLGRADVFPRGKERENYRCPRPPKKEGTALLLLAQ